MSDTIHPETIGDLYDVLRSLTRDQFEELIQDIKKDYPDYSFSLTRSPVLEGEGWRFKYKLSFNRA